MLCLFKRDKPDNLIVAPPDFDETAKIELRIKAVALTLKVIKAGLG